MAFPRPFGRYVLDERIALGGMAEIFRGRTNTAGFEKKVCIKRILPHFSEQEDFVTMFRDEAALAARLQHANIVQVFDFGSEEDTLFLAMELVDGADLRKIIDLAKKKGISLGIGHAMQIAIEVCRGLHHAHTLTDDAGRPLGIVHRDISPHNVLLSRAGEVKVTDFGIAKASARATHTGTGVVKGKLAYMAPEQAHSRPLDHRVDQFATGIVLWEMLTGERLFSGADEVTVLRKVMTCEVPKPSELRDGLPPSLEEIVMRALSEDPDARFASMRHFEHALSRCLFEVTNDPDETNLRPLVERVLGPPEASRRNTAVLVEAPVLAAPGGEQHVPSLTEAGFSEVFTRGDRPGAVPRGGTIRAVLGDESAPAGAPTMLHDSSRNPVAQPPAVVEGDTGITRTVVPDSSLPSVTEEASAPSLTNVAPPKAIAPSQELAPTIPVMPAVTISAVPDEDDATARVPRNHTPPAPPRRSRSRTIVLAGAASLAVLGIGLGAALGVGADDKAKADADDVTVTVASPEPDENASATWTEARSSSIEDAPPPRADNAVAPEAHPAVAAAAAVEEKPAEAAKTPEAPAGAKPDATSEPKADEPAAVAATKAPAAGTTRSPKTSATKPSAAATAASERPRQERPRPQGKAILEMASGWAHAYLGKRKLCETPCTVELPAGTHTLRFVSGDGTERKHRITVKADSTIRAVVPTN